MENNKRTVTQAVKNTEQKEKAQELQIANVSRTYTNIPVENWFYHDHKMILKNPLEPETPAETESLSSKDYHVGTSNYSDKSIQPWDIWKEYNLNPWDADLVKRVLRKKEIEGMSETESRIQDYQKIIHICTFRIEQLRKELDNE